MRDVMGSAAEDEIGVFYMNRQDSVALRQILIEMGYPQAPISIQVDTTTTCSFANGIMK